MSRKKKNNIWTILLLIIVVAISTYYYQRDTGFYLLGEASDFSDIQAQFRWWIIAHFGFAAFTLFIGPIQFIPPIRNKYLKFHRLAGKFYIVGYIL